MDDEGLPRLSHQQQCRCEGTVILRNIFSKLLSAVDGGPSSLVVVLCSDGATVVSNCSACQQVKVTRSF